MNDKSIPEKDILTRLGSFAKDRMGVPYHEFEKFLKEGDSSIPVDSLHEVLNFACDQLGFWQAEWLFSPVNSPNTQAQTEMQGWEILWDGIFATFVENVPNIKEPLEREQNLKLLQHLLRRGVEYNEAKPFRKIAATILSRLSFMLNKLGLHGIANDLYEWGLYPKGTVARP